MLLGKHIKVIEKQCFTYFLASFVLVIGTFRSFANASWFVIVDGIVLEEKTQKRLEGASVVLSVHSEAVVEKTTGAIGKFILILEPENDYEIAATKEGYVTKKIFFSTKNVSGERAKKGFAPFMIEISLFRNKEGLDLSALENFIGKIYFSTKSEDFKVDKNYQKWVNKKLAKLHNELAEIERDEEERIRESKKLIASVIPEIKSGKPAKTSSRTLNRVSKERTARLIKTKPVISKEPDKDMRQYQTGESSSAQGKKYRQFDDEIISGSDHVYRYENKTILTRKTIHNGREFEYKIVKHKWGGVFFFRDGVPITENLFIQEAL